MDNSKLLKLKLTSLKHMYIFYIFTRQIRDILNISFKIRYFNNFLNASFILAITCLIKLKSNSVKYMLQIIPLQTTFSLTVSGFDTYLMNYSQKPNAMVQNDNTLCIIITTRQ